MGMPNPIISCSEISTLNLMTLTLVKIWTVKVCNQFMPCPFTGPKMFCAGPNFLSQPKNLTTFSASSKTFEPPQKPILLNVNQLFVWHKMFVTAKMCKYFLGLAQKIWTSPKHFRTCKRIRHYFFKGIQ